MARSFIYMMVLSATVLVLWSSRAVAAQSQTATTEAKASGGDSPDAGAAVPRLIAFNGVVRDQSNRPLSGVVGVSFALYKDQEGGAPLWTEIQNLQLDDQGRYGVLLGSTQGGGVPIEL